MSLAVRGGGTTNLPLVDEPLIRPLQLIIGGEHRHREVHHVASRELFLVLLREHQRFEKLAYTWILVHALKEANACAFLSTRNIGACAE